MCDPYLPAVSVPSLAVLHARFLSILPRIERHGQVYFRHLRCRHKKEDAIQEMAGLSWQWFQRLAHQGKDATCFPIALASYAARALRSGCRVCGQERANDVLSSVAQQRHRFAVGKLPDYESLSDNPVSEALADNTKSPPDEAVLFSVSLRFLVRLLQRHRRTDSVETVTDAIAEGLRQITASDIHGWFQDRCAHAMH